MSRASALSQRAAHCRRRFRPAKQACPAKDKATNKRICGYTRKNHMPLHRAKAGRTLRCF
jgi:hypothetical protein